MTKERILVVDDEEDIQELIRYNLAREGYEVSCAGTGEEALEQVRAKAPDLVVLDLMLPGVDGLDVCRRLRSDPRTEVVPIIMVTAKGEEADVVTGLEIGADDYLTKPFTPRVLLARVRAILRRQTREVTDENQVLRIHKLVIDPGRHEVLVDGEPVQLTYTEFQILQLLARRPGWVFTRYKIVDAVRGENYPVTERSVDVQIAGLRKKLGDYGHYIETVRGVGYRFMD